jgi:purine-binding chemotaxis protein CheW
MVGGQLALEAHSDDSRAPEVGAEAAQAKLLLFRVGALVCGLSVQHVSETLRPLACEPMAEMPAFVLGVAVLRGKPSVVLGAAELLGVHPAPPARRWIALNQAGRQVLLAVTHVIDVREVSLQSRRELPPLLGEHAHRFVESLSQLDAELLWILNGGHLVPSETSQAWGLPAAEVSEGAQHG